MDCTMDNDLKCNKLWETAQQNLLEISFYRCKCSIHIGRSKYNLSKCKATLSVFYVLPATGNEVNHCKYVCKITETFILCLRGWN